MLAVSTTWNYARHGALSPAVRELAALGFGAVELRAKGSVPDVAAAGETCRSLRVECPAIHAPLTPATWADGDPDRHLASPDEEARRRSVAAVLFSLRAAAPARSSVVVLHLGLVPVEGGMARQKRWLATVAAGDPPSAEEIRDALDERQAARDPHLEAAARSLHDLKTAEPSITWGIETSYFFHGLPSLEETEWLLDDAGPSAAYWHDTGHAMMLEKLGVTPSLAWLERYGPRTAGLHLHDVIGAIDHQPPGVGEMDWPALADAASARMLRTMEVDSRHSAAELLTGAGFLRDVGLG